MITPAQRRREFVLAQQSAGRDAPPALAGNANPYELMLAKLDSDRRRLKQVQSLDRKNAIKAEILPEYSGWIDGVLAADQGGQDDVVVTVMIWRIDVGDYLAALTLAGYVLRHGLTLPDRFARTPGCLIAEEIADAALKKISAGEKFPLAVLEATEDLTRDADMPDEVRAKLAKAEGLTLEGEGQLERARVSLANALKWHEKVGVKKDIERIVRRIKQGGTASP